MAFLGVEEGPGDNHLEWEPEAENSSGERSLLSLWVVTVWSRGKLLHQAGPLGCIMGRTEGALASPPFRESEPSPAGLQRQGCSPARAICLQPLPLLDGPEQEAHPGPWAQGPELAFSGGRVKLALLRWDEELAVASQEGRIWGS